MIPGHFEIRVTKGSNKLPKFSLSRFSNLKGRETLYNKNVSNTFEILVTLISKWPGITKTYPLIFDYRMF